MCKIKSFLKKKLIRVRQEKVLIPCIEGHYLENRCAFITGGTSGIGYAIAEAFLRNGAKVIITGTNQEKLYSAKEKLVETLDINSEKIVAKLFDISMVDDIEYRFNSIIDKTNIDIFVNNAGINLGDNFPDTKEADFDRIVDVNLKGTYFISQLFAKYMVKENIHGNILNVTSSSALRPAISPYIITKWGERGLTLGMAKKYLPYGIIVNGIAPGSALTPMLKEDISDDLYLEYSPAKRYVSPEEVGNIATILVSSMGRMIVGDTIYMTGGSGIITYDDMIY